MSSTTSSSTGPLSGSTTTIKTTTVETTKPNNDLSNTTFSSSASSLDNSADSARDASSIQQSTSQQAQAALASAGSSASHALSTAGSQASAAASTMGVKASAAASAIGAHASVAASKISAGASSAMGSVKTSLNNFDKQHHISDQVADMTSAASAAIKQGHPLNAIANAPAAARIGQAERAKHEAGPLPEDALSATGTEPKEASAISSTSTIGDKLSDVGSHMKAAISQGHPIHAISNAGTAAMIGQTEREKHLKGPLAEDANMDLSSSTTTSTSSVPSAVTGI